jgi:hypothetical protein
MKRLIASAFVLSVTSLGLMGCNETKSTSKHEMTIDTPSGTTTITTEKEVKETPDKPDTKTP